MDQTSSVAAVSAQGAANDAATQAAFDDAVGTLLALMTIPIIQQSLATVNQ